MTSRSNNYTSQKHYSQAFPRSAHQRDGMNLRDYFAAAAMQGLLASGWCAQARELAPGAGERTVASDAYVMADAMLEERDAKT